MDARLKAALASALGSEIETARGLAGGDINVAHQLALVDGRRLFVKTNERSPPGMFAAEARGLSWLAEAGALRIPEVVAVASPDDPQQFLVLELVGTGAPGRDFDEKLGQGLAALHRAGAPAFGLDHDNFIGRLPQSNRPAPDWGTFYRRERLEPQHRRARDAGVAPASLGRQLDRLYARLDALVGPPEPPARLHGDLWGGNLMGDDRGVPCLIDPAVYGGHREIDLAMMRLFGGFGDDCFAAYEEVFPLSPGWADRVALHQVAPLVVHAIKFGGGYVDAASAAIARYA